MFRRIVLTALIAGAIAGLAAAAVQRLRIVPLIERAEIYEAAAHAPAPTAEGWQPSPGLERAGLTLLADVLTGIGFAFMLSGAFALAGLAGHPVDGRRGLLWGAAGFAAFAAAPALGLAPALPGMAEAGLAARQAWWIGTALATALGIGVAVFGRGTVYRLAGAALVLLPQAIGAPAAPAPGAGVPAELAARFVVASLAAAALFWLLLGGLAGWLYRRLERV